MDSVIIGGVFANMSATGTRYAGLMGPDDFSWQSSETRVQTPMPTGGTIKELCINLSAAPGAGTSYTFTLRKNGIATSLTVTISDTNTQGSDLVNTVSFNAGDEVDIEVVPSGTPTARKATWSIIFSGSTAKESVFLGGGQLAQSSAEKFAPHGYGTDEGASTEFGRQLLITTPGTLKSLYIRLSASPGAGKSRVFTVYKNGVSAGLTCTISDTATSANDTTNTVSVVAGDVILIENNPSGSPTNAYCQSGLVFEATTDTEFIIAGSSLGALPTSTEYAQLSAGEINFNATRTSVAQVSRAMTVKSIYVALNTSPGAGNSYVLTLDNGGTPTSLTTTLSDSETADNFSTDITVNALDILSTQVTSSGTPTTVRSNIAYRCLIVAAGGLVNTVFGTHSLVFGGQVVR